MRARTYSTSTIERNREGPLRVAALGCAAICARILMTFLWKVAKPTCFLLECLLRNTCVAFAENKEISGRLPSPAFARSLVGVWLGHQTVRLAFPSRLCVDTFYGTGRRTDWGLEGTYTPPLSPSPLVPDGYRPFVRFSVLTYTSYKRPPLSLNRKRKRSKKSVWRGGIKKERKPAAAGVIPDVCPRRGKIGEGRSATRTDTELGIPSRLGGRLQKRPRNGRKNPSFPPDVHIIREAKRVTLATTRRPTVD